MTEEQRQQMRLTIERVRKSRPKASEGPEQPSTPQQPSTPEPPRQDTWLQVIRRTMHPERKC